MQQDIAESYRRMQISPPKVIYSEIPPTGTDASAFSGNMSESGRLVDEPTHAPPPIDDDADFEIAGEDLPDEGFDEEDFDLGAGSTPAPQNEILQSAPIFSLREPDDEPSGAGDASGKSGGKTKDAKPAEPSLPAGVMPSLLDVRTEVSTEFSNRFGADEGGAGGDVLLRVGPGRRGRDDRPAAQSKNLRNPGPHGFSHLLSERALHRGAGAASGTDGPLPRCGEPFHVPAGSWDEVKAQQQDKEQKAAAIAAAINAKEAANKPVEISAGEYTRWMLDSHFHAVDLTKLKLKAGSLLKDFQEADVGFAPDGMLIVLLMKGGGLFGGAKKKNSVRDGVLDHLSKGKAREDLPAAGRFFFPAAVMPQLRIVQPIVSAEHSMFAGVPVFGPGRIAVRLPKLDETSNPQFLSFALSEFRRFSQILDEFYAMKAFGAESGIPLEDVFTERHCHFSDEVLQILENLDYYKDDPLYKLKVIGHKCAGCGLVVSEESRAKENIGGKDGKKIAKAKCPKCTKPFGDLPLYSLDVTAMGG